MNLNEVLNCLGTPINNLNTASVLQSIGLKDVESIQLAEGKYSEYFEDKADGFSLIFTDEAMFLGKSHQVIGVGPLYFAGIFLYAGDKDGYSRYRGELPLGIRFDFKRDDLVNLLGQPTWHQKNNSGGIRADRWDDKAHYRVHIAYAPDTKPDVVSLHIPNQ